MDFERRHNAYVDFVRNSGESISASIFWNQLRHEFTTTFIGGKAEVTGWRGKIYDPRTGEYNKTLRKRDKLFILLSRVADFWSRKIFNMASARYIYEKAYAKLNCDENLPKNCRLYSNSVFKVGKNCAFHTHLIRMFSYFSQTYKYCKHFDSRDSVLEIGGAGLLGILFNSQFGVKYFNVDLPEMIGFSSAIIATFLPNAKMLLPNEIKDKNSFNEVDFVFLWPNQIDMIPSNSISLSINVDSFMEMKMSEIISYFELIQRVAKPNSLFFTTNRYEKVTGLGDTEKRSFFEYPWNRANQDIFIRVSPLHQEVKHHLMMQRLQRIIK